MKQIYEYEDFQPVLEQLLNDKESSDLCDVSHMKNQHKDLLIGDDHEDYIVSDELKIEYYE